MQTLPTLVPVEEYLHTSFEDGDREYVDGVIVERNLGERDHSRLQRKFIAFFSARERTHRTYCFPEQRVQVKATRFRVPDVCVYIGVEPEEQIFRKPPFLVIEILSPEDRAAYMEEKIDDYLSFGVQFVWVIDPKKRRGYIYSGGARHEVSDGILWTKNPDLELSMEELFQ